MCKCRDITRIVITIKFQSFIRINLKKEINSTGIQTLKGKKAYFADIVIMGGHNKFNFDEIKTATLAIRNGADFIATNKEIRIFDLNKFYTNEIT